MVPHSGGSRVSGLEREAPEGNFFHILTHNLFDVDLNPESVEIAKLALWLKTARTDRPLNDLGANLRRGNSIVSPAADLLPDLAADAFDWRAAFPKVFEDGLPAATEAQVGGFDGRVRHRLLTDHSRHAMIDYSYGAV